MIKKLKIKYLYLFGIFVLAFILRIWNLSSFPVSLSMDEVTFGYSAYSVLNTGKDEYGKVFPLTFKGMGDYKPPVDVYLKIPFIKLLGLNEFSVRLPGVIIGSLTTIVLYLWLKEIKFSSEASLFSSFWLAVSGWHIFFSRAGFEAITALFFLILGLYLIFRSFKKHSHLLLCLGLMSLALSTWSYHAERIYVPLMFTGLLFICKDQFKKFTKQRKKLFIVMCIFLVFVIPFLFLSIFKSDVRERAMELWIAKSPDLSMYMHKDGYSSIVDFVINNDFFLTARYFIGQYLKYYDLKFWFWKGIGITSQGYPDIGLLYLVDLPLLIVGIFYLIRSKSHLHKKLALVFFILAGVPGAFARGEASPVRALVFIPLFAIIFAYIGERILAEKRKLFLYLVLLLFNIVFFFNLYFNSFHKFYADLWHFGYKEAVLDICATWQNYNKVILTDRYGLENPSIKTIPHYYVLFHCKYDPPKYISDKQLYNLEIRQPQWEYDRKLENTLLIGSIWDFPENFPKDKIKKVIYFPNGKPALYFVDTKNFSETLNK